MTYTPGLNGGRINVTLGGNSTSAGAGYSLASTGTVTLAGGNNITLSQNGNAITVSGANAPTASVNFSAGTTSNNLASITFSNSNGVSFGLNGSTITGSVQTNYLTSQSNQAVSGANGSFTFQTATFANSNGVSFSTGTQGLYATVQTNYLTTAMQSNAATISNINMSAGTTSTNASAFTLANSNGISFGLGTGASTGSITATVATNYQSQGAYLTTARASTDAIGLNTAQTNATWTVNSSGLSFNGAGYAGTGFSGTNATATLNSNGLKLSVGAGGGGGGVALYDGANSITSGTAYLSNGNGVSLGINGQTVTASVAAQSVQTQNMVALYDGANSITSGTAYLADGDGVSLGINGQSVTASVSIFSQSIGMNTSTAGGATGGTSGNASGPQFSYNFFAGSNVTLSQSLNGASGSLSIYAPAGGGGAKTLSYWENLAPSPLGASTQNTSGSLLAISTNMMIIQPLSPYEGYQFGGNMTVNTMMLNISGSPGTTSSSHSMSVEVGLYTMANSTQLSLVNSVASTWAFAAATSNSANYNGPRFLTFHSSLWSTTPALSQDVLYWWGVLFRSSNLTVSMSWLGQWLAMSAQRSGTVGISTASATSMHQAPFLGIISSTSVVPASIGMSQVQGVANVSAGFMPHLVFNNLISSF